MSLTFLAIALAASGAAPEGSVAGQQYDQDLAVSAIAQGHQDEAIAALEAALAADPHDPALMINLGIAYAHNHEDARAHQMFKAALTSPKPIELDTVSGTSTDSRRLARKAMKMLERGEFRPVNERLTLRD